jgi:hypothetical protein
VLEVELDEVPELEEVVEELEVVVDDDDGVCVPSEAELDSVDVAVSSVDVESPPVESSVSVSSSEESSLLALVEALLEFEGSVDESDSSSLCESASLSPPESEPSLLVLLIASVLEVIVSKGVAPSPASKSEPSAQEIAIHAAMTPFQGEKKGVLRFAPPGRRDVPSDLRLRVNAAISSIVALRFAITRAERASNRGQSNIEQIGAQTCSAGPGLPRSGQRRFIRQGLKSRNLGTCLRKREMKFTRYSHFAVGPGLAFCGLARSRARKS